MLLPGVMLSQNSPINSKPLTQAEASLCFKPHVIFAGPLVGGEQRIKGNQISRLKVSMSAFLIKGKAK